MSTKMPRGYRLIKAVRKEKQYKENVERRDRTVRNLLEYKGAQASPAKMILGGLYLLEYFEPKTKEELEYYDALPCSIVFGRIKTKNGEPRILCFNLHYYPPKMRYRILDRIMTIYKDFYREHWVTKKPRQGEVHKINYQHLLDQLTEAKLDFGVRMYIPNLIHRCWYVPPEQWSKAVFTEGRFKKRTREAIMNYWRQWKEGKQN